MSWTSKVLPTYCPGQSLSSACDHTECPYHMAEWITEKQFTSKREEMRIKALPFKCFHNALAAIIPHGASFAELGRLYGTNRQEAEKEFNLVMKKVTERLREGLEQFEFRESFKEDSIGSEDCSSVVWDECSRAEEADIIDP